VTPSLLVASKLIAACVWCVFSGVAGAVAMLLASRTFFHIGELFALIDTFKAAHPYFSISGVMIFIMITALVCQLACTIMQIYCSLAIGQLPVFGGRRIIFAIFAYIGTSVIIQATAMIGAVMTMPYFESRFTMLSMPEITSAVNMVGLLALAFNLFFTVAMFGGTSWILKRKLNLE